MDGDETGRARQEGHFTEGFDHETLDLCLACNREVTTRFVFQKGDFGSGAEGGVEVKCVAGRFGGKLEM